MPYSLLRKIANTNVTLSNIMQQPQPPQTPHTPHTPQKENFFVKRASSETDYQLLGKVLLVGNVSVGKSSLLYRVSENGFKRNGPSTIGVEFATVRFQASDGTGVKIQFWDCAGQERFQSIVNSYFRQANIIVFTYDITNYESFKELEGWMNRAENAMNNKDYLKVVVGNKSDLESVRTVESEVARNFATEHQAMFFEVSAKDCDHGSVVKMFETIIAGTLCLYQKGHSLLQTTNIGPGIVNLTETESSHKFSSCSDCL